jgi:hypothetical protein
MAFHLQYDPHGKLYLTIAEEYGGANDFWLRELDGRTYTLSCKRVDRDAQGKPQLVVFELTPQPFVLHTPEPEYHARTETLHG